MIQAPTPGEPASGSFERRTSEEATGARYVYPSESEWRIESFHNGPLDSMIVTMTCGR